nr:type II toxin-antitoxin system HigB family toxin [Paraburkholderia ginsengisoli]
MPPQYTVFDVGGNRSRIVAAITMTGCRYSFVKQVLTHAEYDLWTRKNLNS